MIWFCTFGLAWFFPHTGFTRTGHSKPYGKNMRRGVLVLKFLHSELPFDRSQNRVFNTLPKPNVYKWSVMGAVMKHVI